MTMAAALIQPLYERNQEATCYVGNLDLKLNEEILWELFLQTGPVVNIHVPRDKITGDHQGYGFVEFRSEEDADYAIKIMHMVKLYGKPIKVNKASQDKRTQEVGANLFVGNLHDEVDEKMLRDIFNSFGVVLATKIMRDGETGDSKHYGFVSFDNFESSDNAIASLNSQYICGRPIEASYAYKKDTKGERHGSAAERILAANRPSFMGGMFPTNMISTAHAYSNYLMSNTVSDQTQDYSRGGMGNPGFQMPGTLPMAPVPGVPQFQSMPGSQQYAQFPSNMPQFPTNY